MLDKLKDLDLRYENPSWAILGCMATQRNCVR